MLSALRVKKIKKQGCFATGLNHFEEDIADHVSRQLNPFPELIARIPPFQLKLAPRAQIKPEPSLGLSCDFPILGIPKFFGKALPAQTQRWRVTGR